MTEVRQEGAERQPLNINQIPEQLIGDSRAKLHTAIKALPKTNLFKEILAGGDRDAARTLVVYLMNMEESPWGQTEDDDHIQANIYSSSFRVKKMADLVRQAEVTGDGKCPDDIEIAEMLLGISEPKEDIRVLANIINSDDSLLGDILSDSSLAQRISKIFGRVKKRMDEALAPVS